MKVQLQATTSISGTLCTYNFIPLHTEFRLKYIVNQFQKLIYLITAKYNSEQQRSYNTFPSGSTDQHVTFLCFFFTFPGKREMGIFMHYENVLGNPIANRFKPNIYTRYVFELIPRILWKPD